MPELIKKPVIIIVDDDNNVIDKIKYALQSKFEVKCYAHPDEVPKTEEELKKLGRIVLKLLDLNFSKSNIMEWCGVADFINNNNRFGFKTVIITAHPINPLTDLTGIKAEVWLKKDFGCETWLKKIEDIVLKSKVKIFLNYDPKDQKIAEQIQTAISGQIVRHQNVTLLSRDDLRGGTPIHQINAIITECPILLHLLSNDLLANDNTYPDTIIELHPNATHIPVQIRKCDISGTKLADLHPIDCLKGNADHNLDDEEVTNLIRELKQIISDHLKKITNA